MTSFSLSKYPQDAPGGKDESRNINDNFTSLQFEDMFFVKLIHCCQQLLNLAETSQF